MLYPKKFTDEDIQRIISGLKILYPDLTIELSHSDKRFLRVSKIIGYQNVDTISGIPVIDWTEIHLTEAENLYYDLLFNDDRNE